MNSAYSALLSILREYCLFGKSPWEGIPHYSGSLIQTKRLSSKRIVATSNRKYQSSSSADALCIYYPCLTRFSRQFFKAQVTPVPEQIRLVSIPLSIVVYVNRIRDFCEASHLSASQRKPCHVILFVHTVILQGQSASGLHPCQSFEVHPSAAPGRGYYTIQSKTPPYFSA